MRLDKFLTIVSNISRKDSKNVLKQGLVKVNNIVVKDGSVHIDEQKDQIMVNDKPMTYQEHIYIMLNKPEGVISATQDNFHKTVIDLLTDYQGQELFPVGRLDIDTLGLLLITNDGALAHKLLSPKKHVEKTYYLKTSMPLTSLDMQRIEHGVMIDGKLTLPSKIIEGNEGYNLTITEGKYHQVKRMIKAVGKEVIYLKRIKFGPLALDQTLSPGSYRPLTTLEVELLNNLDI